MITPFHITSPQNALIQYLARLNRDAAFRAASDSLLVEGRNLVFDLLQHTRAKRLIVQDTITFPDALHADEVIIVPERVFRKVSTLQNPEGIVAELPLPRFHHLVGKRRIVICDRIQDPGNLGTILRTALALKWDGAFLLPACADPFNDKALRAAKGATFHLPLERGSWEDLHSLLEEGGYSCFVADMHGKSPQHLKAPPALALLLGNEARGPLLPKTLPHHKVTIPTSALMRSVNVAIAAGILMYLYAE